MKRTTRILYLLLALVLLFTFSLPVSATMVEPVQDVVSVTGGSSAPEPETEATEDSSSSEDESTEPDDADPPDTEDGDTDPAEDESSAEEEQDATEPTVPALGLSAVAAPTNADTFVVDCTPEEAAKLIAFYEALAAYIEHPPIRPFASDGDSGSVSWVWGESVNMDFPSGDPNNPYHINNIPRITLSTSDMPVGRPFCAEFGPDPGGSYTASEGSDSEVLGILVAFQKGNASAVGVQLALWYIFDGLPVNNHPQAAAALSAGRSADTTGYTYYEWNGSGQPFVTLDNGEPPDTPELPSDPPPTEPTDPPNPNTHTEVTTDTTTRTEIRSNTEYEYSDGTATRCCR